jgi:hypothetical protein
MLFVFYLSIYFNGFLGKNVNFSILQTFNLNNSWRILDYEMRINQIYLMNFQLN